MRSRRRSSSSSSPSKSRSSSKDCARRRTSSSTTSASPTSSLRRSRPRRRPHRPPRHRPGDPDLLTLGSLAALRAIGRAVTVLAPPELVLFLEREGVRIERDLVRDPQLFLRGSSELVDEFAGRLDERDLGLGVLGNPLSDFAGLPILLRALEARRIP